MNDYILKDLKTLHLKSLVKEAQKQCKNFPITHIPVVENGKLIGSFAQSDVQTIENKEDEISNYFYLLEPFFTDEKATVLELLKLFADNDCNIIPVLNSDKNYIGYYDLSDVLDVFINSPFLYDESATLIVEKNKKEYAMSEIAQIIETNNASLLGAYVSARKRDAIEVTLKVSTEDMNEIIQTFRRYNYTIITEHKDDMYLEDLKDRSEYLQKYLNM
ncbi:MAG: CBS domain-containing protein [Polaribacter sp.]